MASLFAVHARTDEGVVGQLAALGVKPDDIRYVVNSHFHFDHCGCNASFPRATFLVQRAELALARAEPKRYDAKDWDLPLEYRAVDGEHDVFGDGSVVLLPTPGHTAGHQSLWIRRGTRRAIRADRGRLLYAGASREDDPAHERLRRGADDGVA